LREATKGSDEAISLLFQRKKNLGFFNNILNINV